jgi:hypothetical protein
MDSHINRSLLDESHRTILTQKRCPRCGLAWESFGSPHSGEQIEWEVRPFRRRTIRPKYRRPPGCHCQPQRRDIISAPLAPALIPKGMLAPSFLSEVLSLKFLYLIECASLWKVDAIEADPGAVVGLDRFT